MAFLPGSFINRGASVQEFSIEKGQSLATTARLLAEKGIIVNRFIFVAYAIATGQERQFKAGRYLIPPSASIRSLVNMFAGGFAQPDDIAVTIPEGSNVADIDRIFAKAGLIHSGDLLNSEILSKEGFLFPDTYRFGKEFKEPKDGLTSVEKKLKIKKITEKLEQNFQKKTADILGNLGNEKARKAVVIASLLEKEVKTEDDMKLAAGILEKRLALRMPLQIDAAIAYGVCYPEFWAGRYCDVASANIVDNIGKDSVYNTYRNKGLPPAPISNPGLKAINAALNPTPSDYLYYLSAKDGKTIFSKTVSEHLKARKKYLGF